MLSFKLLVHTFPDHLPIDEALPRLTAALAERSSAVLVAPPGAGKTTRVPLVLLHQAWCSQKRIILLEPRRIAARAAAERMASSLGEKVGETVGLRVRLGSKIGSRTRIEVVTEGVFARMVLDDPELNHIAAVLFDEFHERSLDGDLGLALALDAQSAFRPDLRILVMSATLDGARVAGLLNGAPVIESLGRSYPVETLHAPRDPRERIEEATARLVRRALGEQSGSVLVFLPGQAEIRRTAERLRDCLQNEDVVELHGGLDAREQDRAIRPAPAGRRKVVLATSIAETSLTIEGVRIVVDAGLARVPVFEPSTGLTRLETVKVSRAQADQRRGRAGRTEPGVCYRMWEEAATASLPAFQSPEILAADLSGLLLDLAAWGVTEPQTLCWLDKPPAPAVSQARKNLQALTALDERGQITERGQAIRGLPLPPHLAAMVIEAARRGQQSLAAEIAVVLVERGLGGDNTDIAPRVDMMRRDRSRRAEDSRRLAEGWARQARALAHDAKNTDELGVGALVALAYPDRIAQARGRPGEFRLANGRGASVEPADAMARETFLAVADLAGAAGSARIRLAASISLSEIEALFADGITTSQDVVFDSGSMSVRARARRKLGALVLSDAPTATPRNEASAVLLAEGVAQAGIAHLPWTKAQLQWRERVAFLRRAEPDVWPDLDDAALADTARDWLAPYLSGKVSLSEIGADDLDAALKALIPYDMARRLEQQAPTHFEAPTGSRIAVDYSGAEPTIAVRVQELFGLDVHPALANGRVPLVLELLSPAHRPVQVTRDLPGFWRGSWAAVRAEMRGRYPRHPWPEDPRIAEATRRAKPRGT